MSELSDNNIIENFFIARGWTYSSYADHPAGLFQWFAPDKSKLEDGLKDLPNILESYSAFKEHVLEVMGEEGWKLLIEDDTFFWIRLLPESECSHTPRHTEDFGVEIKSNNILHDAVIAATSYFNSKEKTVDQS